MADSPRPRGRPPHNPHDVKQHTLSIRTTKALKDLLVRASKVSGRSLAGEIEFRLLQSLAADREKSPAEVRLDRITADIRDAMIAIALEVGVGAVGTRKYLVFDRQVLDQHGLEVQTKRVRDVQPKPTSKSRRS
jgi:hypothetical protein